MINEYIVRFSKSGNSHELHISAHDEEEAIRIAEMQARYSKMGGGKFKFIDVRLEGEAVPETNNIDLVSTVVFIKDLDKLKRP